VLQKRQAELNKKAVSGITEGKWGIIVGGLLVQQEKAMSGLTRMTEQICCMMVAGKLQLQRIVSVEVKWERCAVAMAMDVVLVLLCVM
jgi:hypothetical protein